MTDENTFERHMRLAFEALGSFHTRHEYGTGHALELLSRLWSENQPAPDVRADPAAAAAHGDMVTANRTGTILGLMSTVEALLMMRERETGATRAETLDLIRRATL